MKELLGKRWRKLVGKAKFHKWEDFSRILRERYPNGERVLRERLNLTPKLFWQASSGSTFVPLPKPKKQQLFAFPDDPSD